MYLLYLSKGQTLFFPKRIFETPEDENWFRNEVFFEDQKQIKFCRSLFLSSIKNSPVID
ncbi:YcxB family protein [Flavobacterium gyeonganense]|uniref:YcxB family protein n=1 Tax=Flavobacterium gyeonganense TaxID=1310418 RepID=UPI003BF470A0